MIHDHQLIANRLHILDDVGGEQHQSVLRRLGKEVAKVNPFLRIESHRGLVEDQKLGGSQQGLGNADPLALAAGERADFGPAFFAQVGGLDGAVDGGPAVRDLLERGHIVEELKNGQLVIEAKALRQIAERGFERLFPFGKRRAIQCDGA